VATPTVNMAADSAPGATLVGDSETLVVVVSLATPRWVAHVTLDPTRPASPL